MLSLSALSFAIQSDLVFARTFLVTGRPLWYQTYKKSNLRPNTQMSYERRIYQHIIPALVLASTPLDSA